MASLLGPAQVIFKANIDDMLCLRLSDGSHISPIVYLLAKRINESFTVGAVITIKEVGFYFI